MEEVAATVVGVPPMVAEVTVAVGLAWKATVRTCPVTDVTTSFPAVVGKLVTYDE